MLLCATTNVQLFVRLTPSYAFGNLGSWMLLVDRTYRERCMGRGIDANGLAIAMGPGPLLPNTGD